MKQKKSEVDYSPGHANSHCGELGRNDRGYCRHFDPPASCKLVAGRIERSMWCKKFQRAVPK